MQHAITLGAHDHLLGVYEDAVYGNAVYQDSVDDSGTRAKSTTAVIMVTAGMLHHAGPFRLHVDLARSLAVEGLPSLRFDLSGIGESFGIGSAGRSLDRAASEIRTAIDWLAERHGIERVMLFGLCSGADDAIAAAVLDPRVVGVVAMDGCGYRTGTYYWHRFKTHYLPRMLRMRKWGRLISRRWRPAASRPASLQPGFDIREFPPRDVAQSQLGQLADQGTRLHFLYTGGVSDYFNHAGQFDGMFPMIRRPDRITSEYWAWIDHVAFLCEDREKLVQRVVSKFVEFAGG